MRVERSLVAVLRGGITGTGTSAARGISVWLHQRVMIGAPPSETTLVYLCGYSGDAIINNWSRSVCLPFLSMSAAQDTPALLRVVNAVCKHTCDCLTLDDIAWTCTMLDSRGIRELVLLQRHLMLAIREGTEGVIYTLADLDRFDDENGKRGETWWETERNILMVLQDLPVSNSLHGVLEVPF